MTIRELVALERRRIRRLTTLAAVGSALAALGVLLAVGVLVLGGARWISLPAGAPFVAWGIALAAAAAVAAVVARRFRKAASVREVAGAVERERALRRGSVLGVLELGDSSALARAAEQRLQASIGSTQGPLAPDHRRLAARRGIAGFAAFGAGALLLAVFGARAPDGLAAISNPVKAARGTLLPPIRITNAPSSVLRGEPLAVTIHAEGRRTVTVSRRATGSGWQGTRHTVDADGRARIRIESVDADLVLVAGDGRSESDSVSVRVTDRPFLGDLVVRAVYPGYLGRPPETLAAGAPMRVPQGAVLQLSASASTELRSVWLNGLDGDTLVLEADGRTASGRLTARRSGRWAWGAAGRGGPLLDLPPALELDVVPDSAPIVEIVAPARDTLVFPSDTVRLTLRASDDHGVGTVLIRSWRLRRGGGSGATATEELAVDGLAEWSGEAILNLAGRGLEAGDELRVVAVAVDASPWRQAAESRELILRVPLPDEQRAAVREAADSAAARASELAAAQRALTQRTEDAARSRDRSSADQSGRQQSGQEQQARQQAGQMSYQSAERARQLASDQRELQERARQAAAAAEQLERQLNDAGAMDESLQQQLRDARRLMEEALSPDLQRQLQELEQAAQGLNEQQTRDAMTNLAERQRQLRDQLARSAEMLRRAALEGAMETLRDEAEDLAAAQNELADSLSAGQRPQQSGEQASELERRTERLTRDMEQLQERLRSEQAEQGATGVARARPHAEASSESMRSAAEQARAGQEQAGDPRERSGQAEQQRSTDQRADQERQQAEQRQQQTAQQGEQRQQQAGQQQAGQQGVSEQRAGQQAGQQQGENRQSTGAGQDQRTSGGQGASQAAGDARSAAQEMDAAARRLGEARQAQVDEWKEELASQLDQAVSEMMQLAREQQRMEQAAQGGQASASELRAGQSSIQQGVERTSERISEAGRASSHLSQGTQRAMAEARQQVERASQSAAQNAAQGTAGASSRQQMASAMGEASQALTRAAASLVRDRERVNAAGSASGFGEMIQEMRALAQQQGAISSQTSGLLPNPGQQAGQGTREAARQLGRQQREVARRLDDLGDRDPGGRTDEMAREARQLADALEMGALDPAVAERQQRLFRQMLDAGRTLQRDEREDMGQREGERATTSATFVPPGTDAEGRAAREFRVPDWNELRGLSAEERRMVMEYFRRLNAERDP